MDKEIAMKYSLLSILIASLFLSACGTDDENKTPNNIPKPDQPQSDANTKVLTLGSNNNVASLSNVVQATFSPQDAKNNPVITIRKAKDKNLVEPFNWAKTVLDIENGSDYEVTLSSSKPLSSPVDMELSVPIELSRSLNDQNALAAYIVTTIDDGSQLAFVPITSTYNPETQKLLVTLPNGSSHPDSENKFFNTTVKIGLAKAVKAESIIPITATARMVTLPKNGESVTEASSTFKLICPVNGVCTETSRYGPRKPGTVGAKDYHYGIDFRATSANSLIAAAEGTIIGIKKDKYNGSIALRIDGGKSTIVYRHMSEIDSNIKIVDEKNNISGHVAAGTILGKAGKAGVTFEHLHLEVNRSDALLVCKGTDAINRTCTTAITAQIDPFPTFVNSLELVNKPRQETSVIKGQKFNLELQAFDIKKNRINSEINNQYSESIKADKTKVIQPQGSLRSVNWSVNPSSAYKVESEAKLIPDSLLTYVTTNKDDPEKRNSATVTVNQEESATITASWDGLDNLKAEYKVNPAYIYDVSPKSAELGQVTKFSINGVGLSDTVSFSLPNCTNVTKLGGTDTRRDFSCTPTSIGKINGIVKGGAEDFSFTVTVSDNTEMQVELLNGSYYHRRVVSHPSEYGYQVYHAHLLNMKVSAPMYSVVYFTRGQILTLDCGGWKKTSYYLGEACIRTEGDPPTVNMSWKMLTGCGGEGCFPYLININISQFKDSTHSSSIVGNRSFNYITSPLKVIDFPEVKSERPLEYDSFF